MRLSECSEQETAALVAIIALSTQNNVLAASAIPALMTDLAGDITSYATALGELRRKYFCKGTTLHRPERAAVQTHDVRVTERWK